MYFDAVGSKSLIMFLGINLKLQLLLWPLWTDNVCLHYAKFHDNKDFSKQLPSFGSLLTNIRKEMLLLIRTDSGIFLMQMILPTALWVIIQARIGSDCMRLLGNTLLWIWMKRYFFTVQIFQMIGIKFRMMRELNIFIKLKIKGFGSSEDVGI